MEKFNFFRNGTMRLPPGFRFQPTDEELLFQYLKCKVLSWPLPASIIPEVDIYNYDPWNLPGNKLQERYFFNLRETFLPKGKKPIRETASGRWKATGVDKKIASSPMNQLMGVKRTFVFYKGKLPRGFRTHWIMHEYHLVVPGKSETSKVQKRIDLGNWVLCRVFLKKGRSPCEEEMRNKNRELSWLSQMISEKVENGYETSSSSPRSGITEVCLSGMEECEESSGINGKA